MLAGMVDAYRPGMSKTQKGGVMKTRWVEPGKGARASELLFALGLPKRYDDYRTELAFVDGLVVALEGYDRVRGFEALRRIGINEV